MFESVQFHRYFELLQNNFKKDISGTFSSVRLQMEIFEGVKTEATYNAISKIQYTEYILYYSKLQLNRTFFSNKAEAL